MTIRYLHTVCLACNRAEGTVMCDLCSRLVDAEQEAERRRPRWAYRVDVTPPNRKDAAK